MSTSELLVRGLNPSDARKKTFEKAIWRGRRLCLQTAKNPPAERRAHHVATQLSPARSRIHAKPSLAVISIHMLRPGARALAVGVFNRHKNHRRGHEMCCAFVFERVSEQSKLGRLDFWEDLQHRADGDAFHCPSKIPTANTRRPG